MKHAQVNTLCLPEGQAAAPVLVEATVRKGLPRFQITGLSGGRDSADRIRQALQSSRIAVPYAALLVHLGPVDLPKKGGHYDLAIAASLIQALGAALPGGLLSESDVRETVFIGELSLSGAVRPVASILPLLRGVRSRGLRRVVLPAENLTEAALVPGLQLIPIEHLSDLNEGPRPAASALSRPASRLEGVRPTFEPGGLLLTRAMIRVLSIAAAGRHSLLLIGPPGTGKTSLARLLPSLLPPPDVEECLDILSYDPRRISSGSPDTPGSSARDGEPDGVWRVERPLRQPHHSVTDAALIGGGRPLVPGEITRAHQGVLLFDELAEFSRGALQSLREPLEEGRIHLSRGPAGAVFPARFLFVATTNPCPCGNAFFARCVCSAHERQRYLSRILGPLRDRIDLECVVDVSGSQERVTPPPRWPDRIERACARQRERYRDTPYRFNADVAAGDLERYCDTRVAEQDKGFDEIRTKAVSFRKWDRIRRLARTVADLDGAAEIRPADLFEAFSFRCLDDFWKENP